MTSPQYDIDARDQIDRKLTFIKSRYSFKWQELANKLTEHSGIVFDIKNFQRVKSGPISSRRLHDIVRWIEAEYDANFGETLRRSTLLSLPTSAGVILTSSPAMRWRRIPPDEVEGFRGKLPQLFEDVEADAMVRFDYCNLSCIDNTVIIRVSCGNNYGTLHTHAFVKDTSIFTLSYFG